MYDKIDISSTPINVFSAQSRDCQTLQCDRKTL